MLSRFYVKNFVKIHYAGTIVKCSLPLFILVDELHRPSGLHTHFRSKLRHEEEILVTKSYFVVDRNMIKLCARYLLDF